MGDSAILRMMGAIERSQRSPTTTKENITLGMIPV